MRKLRGAEVAGLVYLAHADLVTGIGPRGGQLGYCGVGFALSVRATGVPTLLSSQTMKAGLLHEQNSRCYQMLGNGWQQSASLTRAKETSPGTFHLGGGVAPHEVLRR